MKLKYLIIWILIFSLFSLNFSMTAFALDPAEEIASLKTKLESSISTTPVGECRQTLVPAYDLELMEFLKFLEINFQNKSANSSLTNTAIRRYSEFRMSIKEKFNSLQIGISVATSIPTIVPGDSIWPGITGGYVPDLGTNEIAAYQACAAVTDSYLDLGKNIMIEQIKNTSAQKRTTAMVEKYKAVNTRLRDLNTEVAKMYAYFMTFKSKLPGFLQECVSS